MNKLYILFAIFLLGCGKSGVEELSSSEFEKKVLISQLGESGNIENAERLAVFLEDENPEIVGSACFWIGSLGARNHIRLLSSFLGHENEGIVNLCGSGLALMVNDRDLYLLPKLHETLNHEFLLARMSAIEAIGNIGSKSSTDPLIQKFKVSEFSSEKAQIAIAFGKIKDENSLIYLLEYLEEINLMDNNQPNKGGVRGRELHPSSLKYITEEAISSIKNT